MLHDSTFQKRPKKLLDQVREAMRLKHYAYRTEKTYAQWIRRYILFHNKRHPKEMGRPEIEAFLTDLAVNQQVAASTQNQALNAVLFLYHKVLGIEIVGINAVRANQPRNLPVVLTKAEALAMIQRIDGPHQLVVKLLYGSGLRLSEALRLRIKTLDFAQRQIIVRNGKGRKNRITMLPASALTELQDHLVGVPRQHQQDLGRGFGSVYLPFALARKVSQRQQRLDMAVGVSGRPNCERPPERRNATTPFAREWDSKSSEASRAANRHR